MGGYRTHVRIGACVRAREREGERRKKVSYTRQIFSPHFVAKFPDFDEKNDRKSKKQTKIIIFIYLACLGNSSKIQEKKIILHEIFRVRRLVHLTPSFFYERLFFSLLSFILYFVFSSSSLLRRIPFFLARLRTEIKEHIFCLHSHWHTHIHMSRIFFLCKL